MRIPKIVLAAAAALAAPAAAPPPPEVPLAVPFTYADLADLALDAPVVAGVSIRDTIRLGKEASGVPAGSARLYVEADVQALIRGAEGLPGVVSYLVDVAADAKGRPPQLRKARALLLAERVPERPAELRLIAPFAQLPWTDALERQLRAILTEAAGADAPPVVTGVASAFHVAGALPGESETQIFLATADKRPVSLSILRNPGEQPRWAVALGELVDEAAAPPVRDTLLWYRLACFLPPALPAAAAAELGEADAAAAAADYRLVLDGLGPCARNHPRP